MVIDRATILEWPQIEAMARKYYERLERPYQDRQNTSIWYVARVGEKVFGCYAIQLYEAEKQLWITDMYRVDEYFGALAICRMYRNAYKYAKSIDFNVIITPDPKNKQWIRAIESYGDAELVSLVYFHKT